MSTDKDKKATGPSVTDEKKKQEQKDKITINPNPRANANIPESEQKDEADDTGVGSEITDGEGG